MGSRIQALEDAGRVFFFWGGGGGGLIVIRVGTKLPYKEEY